MDVNKRVKTEEVADGNKQAEVITLPRLPEELLDSIFSYLAKPRDVMAMAGASEKFRRIMTPVLPISLFTEVFPLVYSNLDCADIRNCRLVCRAWSKSVDAFLQTHPASRGLEPYPYHPTKTFESMVVAPHQPPPYQPQYLPSLFQKGFGGFTFQQASEISSFLDENGSHPRSPFILRFLDLANDLIEDHNPEPFWNQANEMLSIFGRHLWRVHLGPIVDDGNRASVTNCYKIIRQAMQNLPELRVLTIGGFDCHRCHHSEDEMQLVLLNSLIQSSPLPELPYLHTLENNIPGIFKTQPVTDELMRRYSNQLRKVYLLSSMWRMEDTYYQNLPNLTELQLGVDGPTAECIEIFEHLNAPLLGKLSLYFYDQTCIRRVLNRLQRHLPNLTYLKLKFNEAPLDLYRPDFEEVRLGNIKTLEIYENEFVSYDLLLSYLPELEYIIVCAEADREEVCLDDGEFQIRTWMFSGSMYTSNIWAKLPTLREFTFAWVEDDESRKEDEIIRKTQYTREKFEYHVQKENNGKSE